MTEKKIGLISGGGAFPLMFAKEARNLGYSVFVVGLNGITPKEIERYAAATAYFKLGQISGPIDFLKKAGVNRVLMAGKVAHVSIFGGIMPDLRAAKLLLTLKDRKANSLLGALGAELHKDGIELINSATFLEHLLPAPGLMAGSKPGKNAMRNIEFGWKAAKTLAGLDIGLTVVLRDMLVIAVEAMEGTDACIKRAGAVLRAGGAAAGQRLSDMAVVKVARPSQDMRFDLPVIGVQTLESMREAGAAILAVEAGKTLILEKDAFLAKAAELDITVISVDPTHIV
ncbi:MAG: hypothetical protein A2270_09430 [Elusimicrobia bacterium RIFOXYA12_FULL_51_18]|nr:MAG: hypothetical protein A2270_09430 [Elusimicrobia bacterium RIFOXYA12_FULL_51_18]OGS32723.1 MAG: hypothetical protein A2218_11745 [Elusimicrobia bacterium RIFOXYA2_FULL_53_38]